MSKFVKNNRKGYVAGGTTVKLGDTLHFLLRRLKKRRENSSQNIRVDQLPREFELQSGQALIFDIYMTKSRKANTFSSS